MLWGRLKPLPGRVEHNARADPQWADSSLQGTYTLPHTPSCSLGNSDIPVLHVFWTVGGYWRSGRKPVCHEEHMQSPRTQSEGRIQTCNPVGVSLHP